MYSLQGHHLFPTICSTISQNVKSEPFVFALQAPPLLGIFKLEQWSRFIFSRRRISSINLLWHSIRTYWKHDASTFEQKLKTSDTQLVYYQNSNCDKISDGCSSTVVRLERWSIFHGDGMAIVVFLQRWNGDGLWKCLTITIGRDGFFSLILGTNGSRCSLEGSL